MVSLGALGVNSPATMEGPRVVSGLAKMMVVHGSHLRYLTSLSDLIIIPM